ncbi:MAG: helix-turn-helix domain-containing protein [Chloroflexi bacterium]|nr:helix-turn-helix domain-containing protein [Chloroflexota bacterium]
MTIGEAAALLGVHPNTVRNRIKSGRLSAAKVLTPYGEAFSIPRAHIDDALHAPPYQPLPTPSQLGGRVTGGSNDLLPPYPERNSGRSGDVGRGCDPPNATLPTPTTVGTLTTFVRGLVTPLMELPGAGTPRSGRAGG